MAENLPQFLYYNCQRPDFVLTQKIIRAGYERRFGVSMSEWKELGSHGPFKIAFVYAPWFQQFIKVKYGAHPLKNPMFADEREWYSYGNVEFKMCDVAYIMFMENAPCVLGPRVLKRIQQQLKSSYGAFYKTGRVNDPYLG